MLLNIVSFEIAKPLSIPHVKEIGSTDGGLYVKFATPQVCNETIERIKSSDYPVNVRQVIGSDAICLENIERFFVKNK